MSGFGDGGNVNSGSGGRLRERRACRGCGIVAVEELVALEEDAEAMGMVVGRNVGGAGWSDVRTVSGLRRWLEALGVSCDGLCGAEPGRCRCWRVGGLAAWRWYSRLLCTCLEVNKCITEGLLLVLVWIFYDLLYVLSMQS